jgi:hypothetical protein
MKGLTWLRIRFWLLEQFLLALFVNFVYQLQFSSSSSSEKGIKIQSDYVIANMMYTNCVFVTISRSHNRRHTTGWTTDLFALRLCNMNIWIKNVSLNQRKCYFSFYLIDFHIIWAKLTSSICIARRATSIGKTASDFVNKIWYFVWDL